MKTLLIQSCELDTGLVGYPNAADAHPDLTPAEYEAILPSNQALLNRSIYADSASVYNLKSWVPQVMIESQYLAGFEGRACVSYSA